MILKAIFLQLIWQLLKQICDNVESACYLNVQCFLKLISKIQA